MALIYSIRMFVTKNNQACFAFGVAQEMEKQGFKIPLLIGGATTSKIHTAVKIAPQYSGPAIYVKDASQSVIMLNKLFSDNAKDDFIDSIYDDYEIIRERHSKKNQGDYLTLNDARKNKLQIDWKNHPPFKPKFLGTKIYDNFSIDEINNLINWSFFFRAWGLKSNIKDASEKDESSLSNRNSIIDPMHLDYH